MQKCLFNVGFGLGVLRYDISVSIGENPMNFGKWYTILTRLIEDFRWKLFGSPNNDYVCLTCGLPRRSEPVDKRLDRSDT